MKKTLIASALLMTFASVSVASIGTVTIDNVETDVSGDGDVAVGKVGSTVVISAEETNHAISVINADDKVTVSGKDISILNSKDQGRGVQVAYGAEVAIGDELTDKVIVSTKGSAIFAMGQQSSEPSTIVDTMVDVQAKEISISAVINDTEIANSQVSAVLAGSGSHVRLGGENTEKITLKTVSNTLNKDAVNIALWVDNTPNYKRPGGRVDLTADVIEISAEGNGDVRAIHVASNTLDPVEKSQLNINADRVIISSKNTGGTEAIGIAAMSTGQINIVGNTTVIADKAIVARGDSLVSINPEGDYFTQITGDVDFNYDKKTSGSGVDAGVYLNLVGSDSYWNGTPIYSFGSGQAPADKTEITGFKLGLSDGAQWTPNYVKDTTDNTNEGSVSVAVNELNFNNGVINVNDGALQKVSIETLRGSGGTINVKASTVDGKVFESGSVEIGEVDSASADAPKLKVQYTGVTSDDVKDAQAALSALNDTVKLSDQTQELTKVNVISEGATAGEISQTVTADGTLGEVVKAENTKLSAYGSVSALSAMTWRHEMNSLSKRMGELRDAPAGVGTWARYYGSEMEYGDQNLTSKNNTIQMGSDYTIGDWKVGVAANYTDGDSSYNNGNADSKNYGLAVYGTWFVPCGAYVDLIAKYSRLDNDFALNGMDGSYENNAFSVSAETGYRFEFMDGGLFVEPQVGVSYGRIMGDDFTAQNGVRIEQDDYDSLIGRMGVRTGFKFPKDKGLIYARVSGVYDFQGEMDAVASKDGLKQNVTEDLGGAWLEFGVGANFNWTNNTYSYIDVERTNGGDVKENYRFNVGIRHTF